MGDNETQIKYLDNITLSPVITELKTRSKEEILNRFLVDYVIASIATYAICSSYDLIKPFLSSIEKKYEISKRLTNKDKDIIVNIYSKKIVGDNLEELTFKFESSNLCMWFLGLSDEIGYNNKCSVKRINELLLYLDSYQELINRCSIRDINELINYYSRIAKYIFSNSEIEYLNAKIISIQEEAVKFILLYNFNKYGINVTYKKDDLVFAFHLPDGLLFESVGENTNELFALSGINNEARIIMSELNDIKVQDDVKKFMNMRFTIHSVDYMNSPFIEKRLLKVTMSRDNLHLNVYYIFIKDHLVRLDSKDIELNFDSDIILSIKVL